MVRMGTVWDRTTAFLGDRSAAVLAIAGPLIFLPTSLQEILRPAISDAGTGAGAALGLVTIVLAGVLAWGQLREFGREAGRRVNMGIGCPVCWCTGGHERIKTKIEN